MPQGTIRWLSADRGFGFIQGEHGEDFFFYTSQLRGVEFKSLTEGQQVEFEFEKGRYGRIQAVKVRPIISKSK